MKGIGLRTELRSLRPRGQEYLQKMTGECKWVLQSNGVWGCGLGYCDPEQIPVTGWCDLPDLCVLPVV